MKKTTCLTALGLLAIGLGGCKSTATAPGGVSYASLAADLTPELRSMTERPIDIDRHIVFTNDHNNRMMWDDLGRVFYTDHPSRLSPLPIMYTSGKPR